MKTQKQLVLIHRTYAEIRYALKRGFWKSCYAIEDFCRENFSGKGVDRSRQLNLTF